MLVEICNYCNKLLAVFTINNKPCCQFCAEQFKEHFQDTKSVLTEEEVMEFLEKNK